MNNLSNQRDAGPNLREPTFTNLERVGILARRLTHDLNNEITSAVMTVSLLNEEELQDDLKDDIRTLSISIDRMGSVLKKFAELLKERPFLSEPYPVSVLGAELERLLKDDWLLKNQVAPDDSRKAFVPALVIKGILEEIQRMRVLPELNREVRLSVLNDKTLELCLDPVQPLPTEGIEPRVTLELIRQSGGALASTSTGYSIQWPLAEVAK